MFKSRGRSALGVLLWWALAVPGHAGPILINEFHYDNAGADAGEFIELAGIAGTSLLGWSVVFYNGADGAPYFEQNLDSLAAAMPDYGGTGFGFIAFSRAGIQNGPDGIALVHAGVVEEFLSYEGVFTATLGPALGMVGIDIGVQESGSTPLGASLQRVGTGFRAEDFSWQAVATATRDAPNAGQRLVAPEQASPRASEPLSATVGPAWSLVLLWLVAGAGRGMRPQVRAA